MLSSSFHCISGIITPEQRRAISNVSGHGPGTAEKYYVLRDRTADARNAASVFEKIPSPEEVRVFRPVALAMDSSTQGEGARRGEGETRNFMVLPPVRKAAQVASLSEGDSEFKEVEVSLDDDYANWGTEHPSYGSAKLKIPWSKAELNHLGKLVKETLASDPDIKGRIYSFCLKKLRRDPAALPIYHKNHVLNSDRLKTGYLRYEILRAEQQEMHF